MRLWRGNFLMSVLYSTMEWRYGKSSAPVIVSVGHCIGWSPHWHFFRIQGWLEQG